MLHTVTVPHVLLFWALLEVVVVVGRAGEGGGRSAAATVDYHSFCTLQMTLLVTFYRWMTVVAVYL